METRKRKHKSTKQAPAENAINTFYPLSFSPKPGSFFGQSKRVKVSDSQYIAALETVLAVRLSK